MPSPVDQQCTSDLPVNKVLDSGSRIPEAITYRSGYPQTVPQWPTQHVNKPA